MPVTYTLRVTRALRSVGFRRWVRGRPAGRPLGVSGHGAASTTVPSPPERTPARAVRARGGAVRGDGSGGRHETIEAGSPVIHSEQETQHDAYRSSHRRRRLPEIGRAHV